MERDPSTLEPLTGAARASWSLRHLGWLSIVAIVGAALAIRIYLNARSLWHDEAALALNILDRDVAHLHAPLDHGQVAPVGFMILIKLVTLVVGHVDEQTLRLIPLAAGIAVGVLTYCAAAVVSDRRGAVIAGLFAAIAPSTIYYASEFKPYSTDMAACGLLLLLALRTDAADLSPKTLAAFSIAACAAAWVSFTAVIAAAGFVGALAVNTRHHLPKALVRLTAASAPMGLMFATVYLLSRPRGTAHARLTEFWANGFIPLPLGFWKLDQGVHVTLKAFDAAIFSGAIPPDLSVGVAIAAVWGAAVLGLGLAPRASLIVAAPWAAALAASVARAYPLEGRLIVFLLPVFAVGVGAALSSLIRSQWRLPAKWLVIAIFLPPAMQTFATLRVPTGREELRPVLASMYPRVGADDAVYVYSDSRIAFDYYARTTFAGTPLRHVTYGGSFHAEPARYIDDIEQFRGRPRVWVVFSRTWTAEAIDERHFILMTLRRRWRELERFEARNAGAYLFDFSTMVSESPASTRVR